MSAEPFEVESFAGLNLVKDQLEVGATGATDCLNVDFDSYGRMHTRAGIVKVNTTAPSSTSYLAVQGIVDGTTTITPRLLLVTRDSSQDMDIDVMSQNGTMTDPVGSTLADSGTWDVGSIVSIGKAASASNAIPYVFITRWEDGTGHTLAYLNTSTALSYTRSTVSAKPWLACAWSTESRLVIGGFYAAADGIGGSNGSSSTVWFSDPGDPATFGANNFVSLTPGDGEVITAICEWQEYLYVFKQRSVYLFQGVSTDSDGSPVFNFRRITLPDQVVPRNGTYRPAAVAGAEGVYVAGRSGIWLLGIGLPVCISDPIRPIFVSDGIVSSSLASADTRPALSYVNNRLYVRYTTSAGAERALVWDPRIQQWTVYAITSATGKTLVQFPPDVSASTVEYCISLNDVLALTRAATDDQGSGIDWTWTSGRYSPVPGSQVVTLESTLTGTSTGAVTLSTTTEAYSGMSGSATLGATLSEQTCSPDNEGKLWSHTISGTGPASINRLTHYITAVRPRGMY